MRRLILAAIAALIFTSPTVANAATYYVAPGATGTGCSQAAPCGTFDRAFDVATAGDTVRVAAGSYGSQALSGAKSSPGVTFVADPGVTVGGLDTSAASWVEVRGLTASSWSSQNPTITPSHITLRNVNVQGRIFLDDGGTDLAMIGGSACCTVSNGAPGGVMIQNSTSKAMDRILFDGVHFYNHVFSGSDHYEVIRIQDAVRNVTVRDSLFDGGNVNTSTIFITSLGNGTPDGLVLENNRFADPGAAYYVLNTSTQPCVNYLIRQNTSRESLFTFNCATRTNVTIAGNIAPRTSTASCFAGVTFAYNLVVAASPVNCSGSDKTVADPKYQSDGWHLASDSPAVDAGGSSGPGTDFEGDSRPAGAAFDAGADETGSSSAPSPQPADTTPPDTTVTTAPVDSTSTDATVAFDSTEAGSTFECRIDAGGWESCASPKQYGGLAIGRHTIDVRATDIAGNTDPSPAQVTWQVLAPPDADGDGVPDTSDACPSLAGSRPDGCPSPAETIQLADDLASMTVDRDGWRQRAETAEATAADRRATLDQIHSLSAP